MSKLINIVRDTYSVIPNDVFKDRSLDYRCRGILCTIISLPNGWDFSVKGLATLVQSENDEKESSGEGVSAIRSAVQRLEKLGYLTRVPTKEKGKFAGYDYQINIPAKPVK